MLKTNKLVSLILAVVLVVSMFTVALTSTSALSDGETWVVAGSGGLCGGEWQMPPSDSNYMSYNPENGNYEIVYNGIAAGTYEFKVVNGTTWGDPDYNLEGQANGGANGTVTVTEANSTVLIGCDGSKAYVQVTAGGDTPVVPDPQPTDAPITGETMTVYFQNNWMWTDVCAYWWVGGAEWPGEAAELVGNDGTYDIYAVTVPTTAEGIIFNGQDAGIGAENKTPDIKDAADGDCYYMVWNDTEQANAVGKESIDVILPDEPATDEPATDEPATDEPATDEPTPAGLFVKADGVLYTVKQGEVYTYEIKIAPDAPVCSWDASVWYDEEGLEPQYPVDKRGNVDKAALCPVFGDSAEVNTDIPGEFLFNYSSSSGKWFEEDDTTALTLGFKVTAAEGIYEINAQIRDLAVLGDNDELISYIEGSEDKVEAEKINKELLFDADPYNPDVTEEPGTDEPGTDEPGTDEPGTDEPGTDEPGTEEPGTEEPPVPETFYVAAGDAPFFGTQWDPANRDNELLPNEDGTYSKTYTDVPAGTYQFKVTTNGAWDIGDYNLEGDAKYGGANAVAEVLYDNATVTIGFDGTKATLDIKYATEPGTEDPGTEEPGTEEPGTEEPGTEEPGTEEPGTEEPSKKLQIRVDNDKVYDVQTGEVYTYTFYLGCDATVASLAATTFYSADGIEFIPALNDKGKDSKAEFVNLSPIIWNHATAGEIKYTYSNVDGYDFPVAAEMTDDNIVFRGSFKVTATEGIYDIYTDLITLGDTDNNKIIFNSEVVNPDVVVNRADTLDGNFAPPVEPGTEEPGTEEPGTEEPGTEEPGTDEPGTDEPGTDEPTEVPGPATGDQSSSDDDGNGAGPGVQTGSTVYAIAFLAVLLMAAGLVMFSRKRSNG